MPVAPTYPGVYIEEIPSGVRTIAGVSTSVTAFIGSAKRGPINKATRVLSFAEFERRFGGLDPDSQMSYGVRQFYMNGGSEAWIVRIAKDAHAAFADLNDVSSGASLKLTAVDAGLTGNAIEVRIDYDTASPASTFNLILNYAPPDAPGDRVSEKFDNLSMNSFDPRYVVDVVNGTSTLVTIERTVPAPTLAALTKGTSTSGALVDGSSTLLDVATLVDPTHSTLRVSANGLAPLTIEIAPAEITGATTAARLQTLCDRIRAKVVAQAAGRAPYSAFACAPFDATRIRMTSGEAGENSTVRVLPGERNDVTARLKLGGNGGSEADAVAAIRPAQMPDPGTLTSGAFAGTDLDTLPDATHTSLTIGIDGYGPDTVSLGAAGAAGANLDAKLADVATRLTDRVRALKPENPSYKNFAVTVDTAGKMLVLSSGSRGAGSSVSVFAAAANSIANELHLLAGAVATSGTNETLLGGTEQPYTAADVYNLVIASRANREGLYALDAVDLFNLLCIPGVSDAGVLADADAYCKERRAFFLIDPPADKETPEEMLQVIQGTSLPKSDYAAVYYPWIRIADPLRAGKPRSVAPSGTIAGLCARTDGSRGVWKAPAGTEATLAGVQGVDYLLSDPQNGTLNPLGVNCVRVFPVFGAIAWGARTLRGADQMASEYKYLPVRRLALFLEESLYRGTKWIVFEPNDERLWAQIRLNVGAFMNSLFRQGAFQGTSPREAYLVKCDKETTTQDDINRGMVNILVGFAPLKPAEFVIIKIQQLAGQIQT